MLTDTHTHSHTHTLTLTHTVFCINAAINLDAFAAECLARFKMAGQTQSMTRVHVKDVQHHDCIILKLSDVNVQKTL